MIVVIRVGIYIRVLKNANRNEELKKWTTTYSLGTKLSPGFVVWNKPMYPHLILYPARSHKKKN